MSSRRRVIIGVSKMNRKTISLVEIATSQTTITHPPILVIVTNEKHVITDIRFHYNKNFEDVLYEVMREIIDNYKDCEKLPSKLEAYGGRQAIGVFCENFARFYTIVELA